MQDPTNKPGTAGANSAVEAVISDLSREDAQPRSTATGKTAFSSGAKGTGSARRTLIASTTFFFSLVFLLYLWTGPGWLRPEAPPPPPANQVEAELRVRLYELGMMILQYQNEHDRLPRTLEEITGSRTGFAGIEYILADSKNFDLVGSEDRVVVEFSTTMDIEKFATSAFEMREASR